MGRKTAPLLPIAEERLRRFGDRLRLARLRRRLPESQVAERAGMTPMTLRNLERGGSGVTIGAYLAVMQVLGIEKDIDLLAQADPVGRELQDARLTGPARTATQEQQRNAVAAQTGKKIEKSPAPLTDGEDWTVQGDFISADALAALIKPTVPSNKKVRRG